MKRAAQMINMESRNFQVTIGVCFIGDFFLLKINVNKKAGYSKETLKMP
jgi:hypothetical protein